MVTKAKKLLHPRDEWQWFGSAGHLCVGRWCRFHLTTKVGPWMVSTVGDYVHPRHSAGSELGEQAWLKDHPLGEEVGLNRFFETMVFRADGICDLPECRCGMPRPSDWGELDSDGYNERRAATVGHLAMCYKWAARPDTWEGR